MELLLLLLFFFAYTQYRKSQRQSQNSQSETYGGDANVEKPYVGGSSSRNPDWSSARDSVRTERAESRAQVEARAKSQTRTQSQSQPRSQAQTRIQTHSKSRRNAGYQQRSKEKGIASTFQDLADQLKEISQTAQGVGGQAISDAEKLRAKNSPRNASEISDVNNLSPRLAQEKTAAISTDYSTAIRDPELAISTRSVFEEDLEAELEAAEDFYSGSEIEDDSWMDLDDGGILMEVDHSLDADEPVGDHFMSSLRDRDQLVRGLIMGDIIGKSKARQ